MLTRLALCLVISLLPALSAAEDFLNVKEGLWETTVTQSGSGMPGMPADALSKMSPEARARVEEMMKQKGMSMNGNTMTVKSCVTKEKIAKGMVFQENRSNCTHSLVKSSSSHMELKMHCENKDGGDTTTIDTNTVVDTLGSDGVKGTTHMVMNGKSGSKNMDSSFTSKYLGKDCGDIK